MWTLAPALIVLRSQINAAFPNRSKASDGAVGDTAHSTRTSDHNPGPDGVVEAIDVTHDPKNFDAHRWVREVLVKSGDKRIKYVISRGEIWNPSKGWRKYKGLNPHDQHVHISVVQELMNDDDPWPIAVRKPLKLMVNGKEVKGAFKTVEGTTVAPVRALAQALGYEVTFDGSTNTVRVGK